MNNKKIILPILIIPFMFSCGEKDMNPISDEDAILKVNSILSRQNDSQLFSIPTKFSITYKTIETLESSYPTGKINTSINNEYTIYYNYDELKTKKIIKEVTSTTSSERTIYNYYDNANGKIIIASESNGYKTRTESTCESKEKAQNIFNNYLSNSSFIPWTTITSLTYIIKNVDQLSQFQSKVNNYKEQHEKYKSETDQYYNYSFGSNDDKSFQSTINSKMKEVDTQTDSSGYATNTSKYKMNNDMLTSMNTTYELSLKSNKDSKYYSISQITKSTTLTYNKADISIPSNISDYILES